MRARDRVLVAVFALVALFASGLAALLWISRFDPLDETRVVAVMPDESGREAAVVFLHHIADYSADVVAVKLVRAPFPALGSAISPLDKNISVELRGLAGWWNPTRAATLPIEGSRQLIDISWNGNTIDLCPAQGARLVTFDAQTFAYQSRRVTLCQRDRQ